jgi:hypothetical protein
MPISVLLSDTDSSIACYGVLVLPRINDKRNSTIKIKNRILAIPAAPAAMPPNPKIAAIIATTKKITVQRNIIKDLIVYNGSNSRALNSVSINNGNGALTGSWEAAPSCKNTVTLV